MGSRLPVLNLDVPESIEKFNKRAIPPEQFQLLQQQLEIAQDALTIIANCQPADGTGLVCDFDTLKILARNAVVKMNRLASSPAPCEADVNQSSAPDPAQQVVNESGSNTPDSRAPAQVPTKAWLHATSDDCVTTDPTAYEHGRPLVLQEDVRDHIEWLMLKTKLMEQSHLNEPTGQQAGTVDCRDDTALMQLALAALLRLHTYGDVFGCMRGQRSPFEQLEEAIMALQKRLDGKDLPQDALTRTELEAQRDELLKAIACFSTAIDFAIQQGLDSAIFLQCWREGDWDGCREWGFPEEAIAAIAYAKGGAAAAAKETN